VVVIAVTSALPAAALDLLRGAGDVRVFSDFSDLSDIEAIVSTLTDRIDDAVLDAAGERLRVVANVAVGYDNIDVAACAARGVVVTNTPDVLVEATADLTFALLLGVTRRVGEGDRLLRAGVPWSWSMTFMLGTGLQGRTLGLVGYGRIGRAVARRAEAFGMRVVVNRRSGDGLALDELLAVADVVSLHCPLTAGTRHLIDAAALRRMRPDAYLINTARGPIVDEAALAGALERGELAGAGLDVFEHEPAVEPRLLALDNVLLTPHLGSATAQTREAMAVLAARNVVAVLGGEAPITPVPVPSG
jgi:glyoxylate reductase